MIPGDGVNGSFFDWIREAISEMGEPLFMLQKKCCIFIQSFLPVRFIVRINVTREQNAKEN